MRGLVVLGLLAPSLALVPASGSAWAAAVAPAVTSAVFAPVSRPAAASAGCDVTVHHGQALRRAVDRAPRGATVCVGPGTYRLTGPVRPRAGQQLVGDHAVLSGARVLRHLRHTAQGWVATHQHQQGQRNGTCLARHHATCTYPDDVLRDGVPLRRVLHVADLRRGTYWFDYRHDRIHLADDPHHHVIEAEVAPALISSRDGAAGADVTVTGFTVEHAATPAQHGAIVADSPGWTIEHDTVQVNHGAGISSTGHVRILHDRVLRNGQLGIGGVGDDTVVSHDDIAYNDTGGFDPAWEAGGAKWALTDHLVVSHCSVHDNKGPGLWTDIDARDTTVEDDVVTDNSRAGIFSEISAGATIRDNTVTGNGHGFATWLWGSGILVAASHDVTISGNTLTKNAEGIGLVQQDRGVSSIDGSPRVLHDIAVSDNTVDMADADSGLVQDDGDEALFSDSTITWSDDSWTHSHGTPFAWDDKEISAAAWRELGHDTGGSFS